MNKTGKEIIGVIGAGTMGSGIAQVAAMAGNPTLIFDSDSAALSRSSDQISKNLNKLAEKGKLSDSGAKEIFNNIGFIDSISKLDSCSLIIEAIIENLEIKKTLFRDLESIVNPECILASNTSSLSITSISSACKKQDRFIGIHFFNPAPLMPLVEIIPGITTAEKTVLTVKKLIDSLGKTTVVAKDTPGFIVNRVARPFYGESIRIYEEQWKGLPPGEKGMATIDWAMKEFGGFRMGPFELMDLIGNDVNYTVTETVWKQFFYDSRYRPSLTQKRLFESGRFGKKTGQGYYNYSEGALIPEPEKNTGLGKQIFMRVLSMLINEASDALYYNVANREDIDMAMTKGVNYPKGLLKWCDEIGADNVVSSLTSLRNTYSEDRYRTSVLLQQLAESKSKFYN